MTVQEIKKPIHAIIIDTGPLIRNTISISTIIASAEVLYTTPAILSEIRDTATRSRVETALLPFLNIRTPSPASFDVVTAFAKKTGDHSVLSRQDLGILALSYEVHCERAGGPWGLRNAPKGPLNEKPPIPVVAKEDPRDQSNSRLSKSNSSDEQIEGESIHAALRDQTDIPIVGGVQSTLEGICRNSSDQQSHETSPQSENDPETQRPFEVRESTATRASMQDPKPEFQPDGQEAAATQGNPSLKKDIEALRTDTEALTGNISKLDISDPTANNDQVTPVSTDSDDSDGDWITPSNLAKHQAKDTHGTISSTNEPQMDVATMTTDYAMQNVLLQMNLRLLSPALQRVRTVRTTVLRCHACFLVVKEADKQFCPRCGQPALKRVSCSTNAKGEFRIHLAKNYQINKRGDKFSVPKPVAGTSNGKWDGRGGGQGGWGRNLVLAEDQKEYTRQVEEGKRMKTRDLMDEDYLPGILTGERGRAGGRPKIGAGRNVNSRRRF